MYARRHALRRIALVIGVILAVFVVWSLTYTGTRLPAGGFPETDFCLIASGELAPCPS